MRIYRFGSINVQYFSDHQEYQAFLYRKDLRREANRLGVLLLLFFGVQMGLAWGALGFSQTLGIKKYYQGSVTLQLLLSGAISALCFFFFPAVYCLIRRMRFARLFTFAHIGSSALMTLCVIGLTFTLMGNYASKMVTGVFALFGVTNSGGQIIESGVRPPIFLYYLVVALLPAFVEEFAFRGVVMGSLRKYSDALAIVVSSAAFALMHGNFVQMPFTFCCGLVFAFIAVKTNSLLPSIIIHFVNNALSVTYDVLTAYRVISYSVGNIFYDLIIIALGAASFFLIRRLIREKPDFFRFGDSDSGVPYRVKVKTTVLSPTVLTFAVIMLAYAAYQLIG